MQHLASAATGSDQLIRKGATPGLLHQLAPDQLWRTSCNDVAFNATWRSCFGVGRQRRSIPHSSGHGGASAFDEGDVAPDAVVSADAFAGADHAEARTSVQGQAGGVLREDAGLHGPDPGGVG